MGSPYMMNQVNALTVLSNKYLNHTSEKKLAKLQISFVAYSASFRAGTCLENECFLALCTNTSVAGQFL
jgi:hypothetical protein